MPKAYRPCHDRSVNDRRPLLIVDGDNLAHRAYHSTPKSVDLNAIAGFFGMLLRIVEEERPRGVFTAWDTLGVDTYRSELWPPYQTGRVFEPSIVRQLSMLPEVCSAFDFGVGKGAGFEADDFGASAARAEVDAGGTCLILTTDRDAYQLASPSVTILAPQRGTRVLERIGPVQVVERFGVLPEQVADFKALCGDPSDKIPGLKGIGPKSAAELLLRYGSLEAVLANWSKPEEVDLALTFRRVVEMNSALPVELPGAPDWEAGAAALGALGLDGAAARARAIASLR